MEKNVYSIEQIFSGRLFKVPDYQRGFAWEVPHCEELMEDLELLPDGYDHYTGTLVLKPNEINEQDFEGNSYEEFDIVDGQQRLTSIILLLDVIKTEMQRFNNFKTLSEGLEKNYLYTIRLSDNGLLFKLTLNRDTKDFFAKNILEKQFDLKGAIIRSHKRLYEAKKTFTEYFIKKETENKKDYPNWLLKTYNKVTQKLKLSLYLVENQSDVGVIFEVMNNRGKPLTELEKVKNYLLYVTSKLTVKNRDELALMINETWSSIFEGFMSAGLGSESENQLLRTHWLITYNYTRKEWDGSKSIKKHLNLKDYYNNHLVLYDGMKNYVRTLKDASIAFADAECPERDVSFNSYVNEKERIKVKTLSIKLKRTKTLASFRPLLVACRLRFVNQGDKYAELVELLEKYAFRVYNMENRRADTGQTSLFKVAFQFYNKQLGFDKTINEIKKSLATYSKETTFKDFWKFEKDENNWYEWNSLKYFLYEYEEHLAENGHVQFSWDYFNNKQLKDTIEHILPQTPTASYWKDRFDRIQRKIYVHDLGNLCLTHNNSSYYNSEFKVKKGKPGQSEPCYSNSSLFQERELANHRDWTIVAIVKRRRKLTDWAIQRWFVDLSAFRDEDLEVSGEEFDNE